MLAQRRSWEGSSPLDSPAGSPHIAPTSPASSSPVAAISLPRHLSPPPASGEIGLSFGDIPRSHSDGEVGVSGTRGTSEDNVSLTSAGSSEEVPHRPLPSPGFCPVLPLLSNFLPPAIGRGCVVSAGGVRRARAAVVVGRKRAIAAEPKGGRQPAGDQGGPHSLADLARASGHDGVSPAARARAGAGGRG